ncbi:MAG TPA: carboxypeptidase regulatory-like domain-containing protein [Bacteroidetes bacterium]|nr:carboxypeptidase regulatory-like domain-containing protein [Bacteroidota bacterium]
MPKIVFILQLLLPFYAFGQYGDAPILEYQRPCHHEVVLLGDNINSDAPNLAPVRYGGKLYFSSYVFDGKHGKKVGRVFSALSEGPPLPFEKAPKEPGLNMAYTAITILGRRVYYTVYREDDKGKVTKSEIRYRDKNYHGKWGPSSRLPKAFGLSGCIAAQPATGIFRHNRKEVLFFVSDRAGGKGKLDIWASEIERDGTFGKPYNLPFNTAEDDVSPYFDIESQTLFFSSKGHRSLGGFDVFRSHFDPGKKWSAPKNLGRPINSYFDDLFFTYHGSTNESYFSSDRPNNTCPEASPRCRDFDIYRVYLKPTLKVYMYNKSDNSSLAGCNVELADTETGEVLRTYLDIEGNFASFGLEPGKSYQIIVSKEGYYPFFGGVNVGRKNVFRPVLREVYLQKM